MSTKMHSILLTLVILALVALTTAFPNGSGTCNSNQTVIEGVQGQPMGILKEDLGFEFAITMENNNYVPGGPPTKFCVHGKNQFKGLLLYALDVERNHVGSWIIPSGAPYKVLYLNCKGDPEGTITHSDPSLKGPNVCFDYVSPKKDVGPINFVGTIVQNKKDGFQIVRFPTIFTVKDSKFNPNATTTTMTTTCNAEPPKTKPTYEKTKPTYEKTKPENTKPTYEETKPTYEPPKTTDEQDKPTNSNSPLETFKPPEFNAANGITYSGFILLLQLMIVSSLIFYHQ